MTLSVLECYPQILLRWLHYPSRLLINYLPVFVHVGFHFSVVQTFPPRCLPISYTVHDSTVSNLRLYVIGRSAFLWRVTSVTLSYSTHLRCVIRTLSKAGYLTDYTRSVHIISLGLFVVFDVRTMQYPYTCSHIELLVNLVGGFAYSDNVDVVGRMNEVSPTLRRAPLTLGWVTVSGQVGYTTSVCNQPTRSTQPCIPPGPLNWVLTLIRWSKGGNITSAGWSHAWHVSSRRGETGNKLLYRVFQKTDPLVYFDDNFGKCGPILTIFSLLQQEINDTKIKLFQPPHLYYAATLPSKTNTDAGISVKCLF